MPPIVVTTEDYLFYVDVALDGMVGIVTTLGDDLANRRPDLDGANSPYALLTHCLGVMEYWAGHVVAGRASHRDRPAEFVATGRVDDLVERTRAARRQLGTDLDTLDSAAPPRNPPRHLPPQEAPLFRTQGGALVHLYEELAQHHGQMEITRDLLLATSPSA